MSFFSSPTLPFWRVEEWLRDYCMEWWPEYEAAYARDWNIPADERLPAPRHWETSSEFAAWDENSLPHIVIVSPGLSDDAPYNHGDGQVDGCLLMTFVHLAGTGARGPSRKLASSYAAITRQMVAQSGNAGRQEIREIRYVDEDGGGEVPPEETIASWAITFEIEVAGLMNTYGGPPFETPREDPEPDPGERPVIDVDKVNVDIQVVEEVD